MDGLRLAAAATALLAACTEDDEPGASARGAALVATVTASALLPNVVTVRWSTATPSASQVEWGEGDAFDHTTPRVSASLEHEVTVFGAPIHGAFALRAVSVGADGQRTESPPLDLVLPAPDGAPPDAEATTTAELDGYILVNLGVADTYWAAIVDRAGRVVWYAPAAPGWRSTSSTLSRDRRAVLYNSHSLDMLEQVGTVNRRALDGSAESAVDAPGGHHDFVELPDGRIALLRVDVREWEGKPVMGDTIAVTDDDGGFTTAFSAWDSMIPAPMCSHFEPVAYADNSWDWLHANSLRYDDATASFLLMSRNLDALFAIDAERGDVRWQLGGVASDFQFTNDAGWDHGHFSDWSPGRLAVFDNGLHRSPNRSRAVVYAVNEAERSVTLESEVANDAFEESLGDVKTLDDGVLVAWSNDGRLTQVDADGQEVWRLQFPDDVRLGHATLLAPP